MNKRPWPSLTAVFVLASLMGTTGANHAEPAPPVPAEGGFTVVPKTTQPPVRPLALNVQPDYLNLHRSFLSAPNIVPYRPWESLSIAPWPLSTDTLRNPFEPQEAAPLHPPIKPWNLGASTQACSSRLTMNGKFAAAVLHVDIFGNETIAIDVAGNELRHPASLTKIMTMLVAFRAIEEGRALLDDRVTFARRLVNVERNMTDEFAQLGVRYLTLDNTLRSMGTKSANDAAIATAEHIAGSESAFVGMMNDMAAEIGMTKTKYKNASGLPDPEQVTTAYDQVVLMRYIQKYYPQYLVYLSTREFSIPKAIKAATGKKGRGNRSRAGAFVHIKGHLALLGQSLKNGFSFRSGKTGFVNASGYNLAITADRSADGSSASTVVLGAVDAASRNQCAQDLVSRL